MYWWLQQVPYVSTVGAGRGGGGGGGSGGGGGGERSHADLGGLHSFCNIHPFPCHVMKSRNSSY